MAILNSQALSIISGIRNGIMPGKPLARNTFTFLKSTKSTTTSDIFSNLLIERPISAEGDLQHPMRRRPVVQPKHPRGGRLFIVRHDPINHPFVFRRRGAVLFWTHEERLSAILSDTLVEKPRR